VYYLPFRAFPRQVGAHVEDNIPEGALLAADAELVQLAHDLSLHAAARWQGEPGQRDDDSTKSTSYQARGIGVAAAAAATLWPDTHTLQSTRLKIQRHPPTKLAGEILGRGRFGSPNAGGGTPWPGPPRRRIFLREAQRQGGEEAKCHRDGGRWGTTVVPGKVTSGRPGGEAAERHRDGGRWGTTIILGASSEVGRQERRSDARDLTAGRPSAMATECEVGTSIIPGEASEVGQQGRRGR
jgi:hypothetical protein